MKPAPEISGTSPGMIPASLPASGYKLRISEAKISDSRSSAEPSSAETAFLEASLASARSSSGYTAIAFVAPIVSSSAIVAAFPGAPMVAWASRELTIVGVEVAHELRGSGERRCDELAAGARQLVLGETLFQAPAEAPRSREMPGDQATAGMPVADLPADHPADLMRESTPALARPRLLGGLAFTPGSAERMPWTGFGDAWFMLPRWTYVHDATSAWLVLAVDARDARDTKRWHDDLATFRRALTAHFASLPQPQKLDIDRGDRAAWRDQVAAITAAIARSECEKVVAARSAVITLDGPVRAADLLAELDARHGDCVRLLVHPPGGGTLVAATPERLVRVAGATVACDALAGSHARLESTDASADPREHTPGDSRAHADDDALLASGKDHREHELVVRAIASTLAELGEVTVPDGPRIRALRHVLHLHTPITATLKAPRHVLDIVARLHPTPAVGGTPTRFATDWICEHELTPRGWYASPVGWFDLEGNGELAVAIRSGVLIGDRAHLWAGAGIVAGSDPETELAETELKLRAMLGALGVSG